VPLRRPIPASAIVGRWGGFRVHDRLIVIGCDHDRDPCTSDSADFPIAGRRSGCNRTQVAFARRAAAYAPSRNRQRCSIPGCRQGTHARYRGIPPRRERRIWRINLQPSGRRKRWPTLTISGTIMPRSPGGPWRTICSVTSLRSSTHSANMLWRAGHAMRSGQDFARSPQLRMSFFTGSGGSSPKLFGARRTAGSPRDILRRGGRLMSLASFF